MIFLIITYIHRQLIIGSQGRGSRTGPLGSGLKVGVNRVGQQESGNTPGYVRAQRARARSALFSRVILIHKSFLIHFQIDSVSPESSLAERMRQKLTLKIRSKSTERISQRDVVVQASNTGPPASPLSDHMSSSKSPCNSLQIQTTYQTIPPPPLAAEEKQRGAVVEGPFVGRARALVDCFASPYDKDALAFNVS